MKSSHLLAICATLLALSGPAFAQDKPGDGEHHGPRPEAIAACRDKKEGDACTFEGKHGTVNSTCEKNRSGDLLFCKWRHRDSSSR